VSPCQLRGSTCQVECGPTTPQSNIVAIKDNSFRTVKLCAWLGMSGTTPIQRCKFSFHFRDGFTGPKFGECVVRVEHDDAVLLPTVLHQTKSDSKTSKALKGYRHLEYALAVPYPSHLLRKFNRPCKISSGSPSNSAEGMPALGLVGSTDHKFTNSSVHLVSPDNNVRLDYLARQGSEWVQKGPMIKFGCQTGTASREDL
jgi:hypothetical protein